jgi:hypothetical protein
MRCRNPNDPYPSCAQVGTGVLANERSANPRSLIYPASVWCVLAWFWRSPPRFLNKKSNLPPQLHMSGDLGLVGANGQS